MSKRDFLRINTLGKSFYKRNIHYFCDTYILFKYIIIIYKTQPNHRVIFCACVWYPLYMDFLMYLPWYMYGQNSNISQIWAPIPNIVTWNMKLVSSKLYFSVNYIYIISLSFLDNFCVVTLCCDSRIKKIGGAAIMLTIGGGVNYLMNLISLTYMSLLMKILNDLIILILPILGIT